MKLILVGLSILWLQAAVAVAGTVSSDPVRQSANQDQINSLVVQSMISIHERVEKEGFENVLKTATWPKPRLQIADYGQDAVQSFPDNPSDDCIFNPAMAGCPGAGTGDWGSGTWGTGTDPFAPGYDPNVLKNMQLKDDGVQILATEVLYQTLSFYKVKHVFGKIKANSWGFKVIDPVAGGSFQDLDMDVVLGAVKQFRKYIIGLLCNNPNPSRMLQMMNKYDVGTRFRWDMAWALLGNELPDTPNKYMRFGAKWRKFSMAMDGIENGSIMRLRNLNGGYSPFDPGPFIPTDPVGPSLPSSSKVGKLAHTGYIAQEVIGIIRLVGDLVAATLELFCRSDLTVNAGKENEKQQAVVKLLGIKKNLYDRYSPMRAILDEMGKKATGQTGLPISFLP